MCGSHDVRPLCGWPASVAGQDDLLIRMGSQRPREGGDQKTRQGIRPPESSTEKREHKECSDHHTSPHQLHGMLVSLCGKARHGLLRARGHPRLRSTNHDGRASSALCGHRRNPHCMHPPLTHPCRAQSSRKPGRRDPHRRQVRRLSATSRRSSAERGTRTRAAGQSAGWRAGWRAGQGLVLERERPLASEHHETSVRLKFATS
jgi:hypothetical protein